MVPVAVVVVLTGLLAPLVAGDARPHPPPPPPPMLTFSFDAAFGSNMVLQREPAQAAVYGFMDFNASKAGAEVIVSLATAAGTRIATVRASLNTTATT